MQVSGDLKQTTSPFNFDRASSRHILHQDLIEQQCDVDMDKLDTNINFLISKHHEFNAKMTLNNSIRAPFNIDNI